jgi:hypothetical protein
VNPEVAAAFAKRPLAQLDTAWSTAALTLRRARQLELSGWAFYVAGRAGVLGDDARAETVTAAIGTIAPDAVRAGWDAAGKVGPSEVAASRTAECARWGDEHLSDLSELDRLVGLADRVVDAADPAALPLFAAARAAPRPDGGAGARAAILVHLLRELGAGALLVAARACGLSAVELVVACHEGEQEAVTLGWQPPFPARMPLLRRYAYADALADRIAGQAYAALKPAERGELVTALAAAATLVG